MSNSDTPLAEASPESLDHLFNLDPQELTDKQVMFIVSKLREDRKRWLTEEKKKKISKGNAATIGSIEDLDL